MAPWPAPSCVRAAAGCGRAGRIELDVRASNAPPSRRELAGQASAQRPPRSAPGSNSCAPAGAAARQAVCRSRCTGAVRRLRRRPRRKARTARPAPGGEDRPDLHQSGLDAKDRPPRQGLLQLRAHLRRIETFTGQVRAEFIRRGGPHFRRQSSRRRGQWIWNLATAVYPQPPDRRPLPRREHWPTWPSIWPSSSTTRAC